MKNDPLVKYALALIAGMLFSAFYTPKVDYLWYSFALVCFLGAIMLLTIRGRRHFYLWAIFAMVLPGALLHSYRSETKDSHYSLRDSRLFEVQLLDEPILRTKAYRARAKVLSCGLDRLSPCSGNILLYLEAGNTNYSAGDILQIEGLAKDIPQAINPNMFSFRDYMQKQHILSMIYAPLDAVQKTGNRINFNSFGARLQKKVAKIIISDSLPNSAVLKALLFGNKSELSSESIQAFSKSGAMHILAVSGLHTGIVYLLLLSMLRLFSRWIKKPGIKSILLIAGIWLFALMTGLRAPVCRAGLMFSLIEIGFLLGRRGRSMNLLALAAIILLIINPMQLWDIGFQLSFAAVAAILLFYKGINAYFTVHNPIVKGIWSVTALAIAAQIGTLAVSLFYFHQFPLLFFLSNLLVLPLAYIIFFLSVPVGIMSIFSLEGSLQRLMDKIAGLMQSSVNWIERVPFSRIESIDISLGECFLLSTFTFSIAAYFVFKRKRYFWLALLTLSSFSISNFIEDRRLNNQRLIGLLDYDSSAIVLIVEGNHVNAYHRTIAPEESTFNFMIKPWLDHLDVRTIDWHKIEEPYELIMAGGVKLYVTEFASLCSTLSSSKKGDHVLVQNRPIKLDCPNSYDGEQIIFSRHSHLRHLNDIQKGLQCDLQQLYLQNLSGAYIKEF